MDLTVNRNLLAVRHLLCYKVTELLLGRNLVTARARILGGWPSRALIVICIICRWSFPAPIKVTVKITTCSSSGASTLRSTPQITAIPNIKVSLESIIISHITGSPSITADFQGFNTIGNDVRTQSLVVYWFKLTRWFVMTELVYSK